MFCPNCGADIPDSAKYCGKCGAKIADFMEEISDDGTVIIEPDRKKIRKPEQGSVSQTGMSGVDRRIPDSSAVSFEAGKKRNRNKKILKKAVPVAGIVLVVFFIRFLFGVFAGSGNAYLYFSDGNYELVTSLKQDQGVDLGSSGTDQAVLIKYSKFSPDGKYVYYADYDETEDTVSLYRANYKKMKKNSSKNDRYIELIGTGLDDVFQMLDDGTVLYKDAEDTLYYYDGKQSTQVAKQVDQYYTDDSKHVVYTSGDSLFGSSLKDKGEKTRLSADCESIIRAKDFQNIIFTKRGTESGSLSLYTIGWKKKKETKLADKVTTYDSENTSSDILYFAAENGQTLTPYDYVVDDFAKEDETIEDPDQTWSTVYSDAYQEAKTKWEDAQHRMGIREALKREDNRYPVKTLYCLKDGKMTAISDKVLDCSYMDNGLMFNTTDVMEKKIKLEDIQTVGISNQTYGIDKVMIVNEIFSLNCMMQNYVILTDTGEIAQISKESVDSISNIITDEASATSATFYLAGSDLYMNYDGTLSVARISKKSIGRFEQISNETEVRASKDDTLYYTSKENGDNLYAYKNGKVSCIAQNVPTSGIFKYEDDVILSCPGYGSEEGDELTLYGKEGSGILIADRVTDYVRLNKSTLLYVSDGDLYSWNGKEQTLIRSNVQGISSLKQMEADWSI